MSLKAGGLAVPWPLSFFVSHCERALKRSFDVSQFDGSPSLDRRLKVKKYFIIESYFRCCGSF